MRRLLKALLALLPFFALPLSAQYTSVSGSHTGPSGAPVANGTIYWQPVSAARIGTTSGQLLGVPVTATVTAGAFTMPANSIADTSLSNPANTCYAVTAIDNLTGQTQLGAGLAKDGIHVNLGGAYGCVQPSGSTYNFDTFVPAAPPTAIVIAGPAGPAGPACSTGSGTCNMTVPIVLPADPASALQAATKQYVDARASNAALGQSSGVPFGSLPLSGWTAVTGYGDSRLAGSDASTTGNRFINQLQSLVGAGTLNNYAQSGSLVADATVQAFNNANPGSSSTSLQVWMPGINDVSWAGAGPPEANFNTVWMAGVSWLAIGSGSKYTGSSFGSPPTNWTSDTTYSQVTGIQSTTNGATAVFPYTTTAQIQQVMLWYGCINGDAGTFTVTDSAGGSPVALSTGPSANIWMLNGGGSPTNANALKSVCSNLIQLPSRAPGSYNLTVAVTSSSGSVHIYGIGVTPASISSTTPFVLALNLYRARMKSNDFGVQTYNNDINDDCSLLRSYNLNVGCVNVQNFVFGTTTGASPEFWDGSGSPPTACNGGSPDVSGSNVHGCDAVQNELIQAAQAPFFTQNVVSPQNTFGDLSVHTARVWNALLDFAGISEFAPSRWYATHYMQAAGTATSGANYGSNALSFVESYWNGTAAAACTVTVASAPNSGTSPNSNLTISSSCPGTTTTFLPATVINGQFTLTGAENQYSNRTMQATATATSGTNYASYSDIWYASIWNGSSATICDVYTGFLPFSGTNSEADWTLGALGGCTGGVGINIPQVRIANSIVLKTTLTGFHGTSGLKVQYSDGTGASVPASFASDGTLTAAVTGVATLSSGTVTVSNAAACTPSATCVYKLTHCGVNSSTGIGTLSVGTISAGTSFVINSLGPTASVLTTDLSTVCWQVN